MEIAQAVPSQDRSLPRILIADDEHVIADTLAIILRGSGFDTAAVYGGAQAVEKARTWQPGLLLSDVMMPGMNGIDAAIEICKLIPDCRVLLFSGFAESAGLLLDSRVECHKFQILQKPLHPAELIARLRGV